MSKDNYCIIIIIIIIILLLVLMMMMIMIIMILIIRLGTAVAQWLRCCATNRKVPVSIPDGVIGIFH